MAGASQVEAGRAFVRILGDDSQLRRTLSQTSARLKAFSTNVSAVGAGLIAAGTAIATPLTLATREFIKTGDQLDKAAIRTGVSVEALSELAFAASQSGADLETLEKGVRRLQQTIFDAGRGLSTATVAFDALGITLADIASRTPEQQFKQVADAIAGVRDPSQRAALAIQVFGRSGTQLLPLLRNGAAGVEQLQQAARDLGLTVSTDTAASAALLNDELDQLTRASKAAGIAIASALAPTLTQIADDLQRVVVNVQGYAKENDDLVRSSAATAAALGGTGVALLGLGAAARGVAFAITGLLNPVGALVAAIGLGVTALVGLTAEFNRGEIAGFDYSRAVGKAVAEITGLNRELFRRQSLEEQAADATRRASQAAREVDAASTVEQEIAAVRRLIAARRDQFEAQRRLSAVGDNADQLAALDPFGRSAEQVQRVNLQAEIDQTLAQIQAIRDRVQERARSSRVPLGQQELQDAAAAIRVAEERVRALREQLASVSVGSALDQSTQNFTSEIDASIKRLQAVSADQSRDATDRRDALQAELDLRKELEAVTGIRPDPQIIDTLNTSLSQLRGELEAVESAGVGNAVTAGLQRYANRLKTEFKSFFEDTNAEARRQLNDLTSVELARVLVQLEIDPADQARIENELERLRRLNETFAVGGNLNAVNRLFDLQDQLLQRDAIIRDARAAGTTDARLAGGLQAGGNIEERQLRTLDEIKAIARELRDRASDNGLVFE